MLMVGLDMAGQETVGSCGGWEYVSAEMGRSTRDLVFFRRRRGNWHTYSENKMGYICSQTTPQKERYPKIQISVRVRKGKGVGLNAEREGVEEGRRRDGGAWPAAKIDLQM